MTAKIIVRPSAERDINQAFDWYVENAAHHSRRFLDDLHNTLKRIRRSPRSARAVYGEVRRAALLTFPYLVWFIYFEESNAISVLALSHKRQNPDAIRAGLHR